MEAVKTRFETALLLCRACAKRGDGPPKKETKELARRLRGAARDAGHPRPRVVLTSCLGACPRKAFTLAATGADGRVAMVAVRADDDAAAAVAAVLGPARPPAG
jgi:predicted metal-binding protein